MRRKFVGMILSFTVAFSVFGVQGQALAYEQVAAKVTQSVSLREEPSLSSDRIRYLAKGETVQVIDKVNAYWYKVKDRNSKIGYVSTSDKYLQLSTSVKPDQSSLTNGEVLQGVSFRDEPSTDGGWIRYLAKGEKILILDKVNRYWYKIKDSNGKVGYISTNSQYVETSFTDDPEDADTDSPADTSELAEKVIAAGKRYLGTPYEFGSSRSNTNTFDCSEFVKQAFLEGVGIKLPSDSRQQGDYVRKLGNAQTDWKKLKPGDIMFFSSYKGSKDSDYDNIDPFNERITHDGIYLGNGKILHTYSKESGGVRIDTIEGKHWEKRFLYGGSAIK